MKSFWFSSYGKDTIGGLVLAAIGACVVAKARTYPIGTASHMGPGFMPVVYGTLIGLVGLVLIATASRRTAEANTLPPDARAAACILGGLIAFIVVGGSIGFAPATFVSVFIAALGDRSNSPRDAALVAGALVVVAAVVFSYGLGLQLPLFRWF
jgi:hypothetical protein